MLFIGTMVPFEVFSADLNNPEIQKLIAEKQQKIAALEECGKKVKGFKIAGISTIGLTAVGTIGNIALSNKREDVSNQLTSAEQTLSQQQAKAREKEECDKNPAKEWTDEGCKDKVTPPATNGNNNPETPETTITNNNENVEAEVDIDADNTATETIVEGRIIGKECISGDLPWKANKGKYIQLGRTFTKAADGWDSKRCWLNDKKQEIKDCSCAATECESEEYEIKQGLCTKKTAEEASETTATTTTTTTTTTIKLDASKEGVGRLCYREVINNEDDDSDPWFEKDGNYDKCTVNNKGDWCVRFDNYIVNGTSACTGDDGGDYAKTTDKNYDSAKSDGQYCYCKMTSWIPDDDSAKNISASSWVFKDDQTYVDICKRSCASLCGHNVQNIPSFRKAVFGLN